MKIIAMIPARYGATRFPAKLMQDLCGAPVIVRTYEARHDFHAVFVERRDRDGGLSGLFQDVEAFAVEGRLKKFGAMNRGRLGIVRVGVDTVRLVGGNLSVDGQDFVAVFDGVARKSDDAVSS